MSLVLVLDGKLTDCVAPLSTCPDFFHTICGAGRAPTAVQVTCVRVPAMRA